MTTYSWMPIRTITGMMLGPAVLFRGRDRIELHTTYTGHVPAWALQWKPA